MMRWPAILVLLLCAAHAQARTLYVSNSGSHDTNAPAFSTWATAATNIQAAIDAAENGDTIRFPEGEFVEYGYTAANNNINITGRSDLSLIGGRGTLFDADKHRIVMDESKEFAFEIVNCTNVSFSGLTIISTNASRVISLGGTAAISNRLQNCIFRGVTGLPASGRTIQNLGRDTLIIGCMVLGNAASDAGVFSVAWDGAPGITQFRHSISEANKTYQLFQYNGELTIQNSIYGNANISYVGGNVNVNTTNSVMRTLGISHGSEGGYSTFVWRGVRDYIPTNYSIVRTSAVYFAGSELERDGLGCPLAISPAGRTNWYMSSGPVNTYNPLLNNAYMEAF